MQKLKADKTIRHIGLSSHTPQIAHMALDAGILDMLMLSLIHI